MIRTATKDDRALVKELRAEFEREVPDELWDDDDEDYEWTYVLLADDVGIAALDRKGDRTWLLDLLYVRPAARGKGLGLELLRAAAEYVQEQGAEMLALEVLESNAAAKRLYDRLGFKTVERTLAMPVAALLGAKEEVATIGAVHVQNDDVEKVKRDAAKVLRREPEVAPGDGWTRVEAQPDELRNLARELSYTTGVSVALSLEDGAVVRYVLFDRGSMVDEYLSVPEYFGELPPGDVMALGANPTVVARLTNAEPARVRAIARTASSPSELPPAEELFQQIAEVLGVQP
ncbi:MAG TPA: GNAT family N-acetyltransferase [Gaiellaceae bacterium]|nr:GNAT family N-acetyltransferase [Gaiellaceae bacterium]